MVMAARIPRVCLGFQVVLSTLSLKMGPYQIAGVEVPIWIKEKITCYLQELHCVLPARMRQGGVRGGIGAERDWMFCGAGTCILFGDGCGAVVLTTQEHEQPCSLLGCSMASDGLGQKHLNVRSCAHQCFCFLCKVASVSPTVWCHHDLQNYIDVVVRISHLLSMSSLSHFDQCNACWRGCIFYFSTLTCPYLHERLPPACMKLILDTCFSLLLRRCTVGKG